MGITQLYKRRGIFRKTVISVNQDAKRASVNITVEMG